MSTRACTHCGLPVPRARRDDPYCCYGCRIAHDLSRHTADGESAPVNTLLLRLGLGVFLTINLMVVNWLIYWRHVFDPAATESIEPLIGVASYLLMFLCTLVIVTLGVPFAVDSRLRLSSSADTLILLGVVAAYIISVINTLRGNDHLYYDTAAVILVLVTLGRYLDSMARTRATVATGSLLPDDPGADLNVGDRATVRMGETIPVDGVVLSGRAHVDESLLTGESRVRGVEPGDHVLAGGISVDGLLTVRAESVGADRVIAAMQRLLDEARLQQPRIAQLADRVSRYFMAGVTLLAVVVLITGGLMDALCVLLISCPCALGLAAPLATWTALGRAARRGILIDSGWTLERAAAVKHIFFDKTGTLTQSRMQLVRIEAPNEDHALAIAAAMERGSTHPIAAPFVAGADPHVTADDVTVLPGRGLRARIDDQTYELTRRDADTAADNTVLYLTCGEKQLARFELAEHLRDDAPAAVNALREAGVEIEILTGDQPGPARRVAELLNVPMHAAMLPADKVDRLRQAQRHGLVAMVGDGINDAPVLGAADVSFAMGSATDLARQAGHIHLTGDALGAVPLTLTIARHAMTRIRLNLLWAFGYNTVGLALAATGRLTPVIAALAMLGSSLLIVVTSRGAGDVVQRAAGQQSLAQPARQVVTA